MNGAVLALHPTPPELTEREKERERERVSLIATQHHVIGRKRNQHE